MFDEEDAQTLVKLGLNSCQAKIYLTLISLGAADAKTIAQTAKIDGGEIYRQLEILQKKVLIEKILGNPNQYKPIALNETIRTLIQQKNKENAEIQQQAEALLRKEVMPYAIKEIEHKISILPANCVIQYVKGAYARVQKEWLWFTQIERIPIGLTTYAQSNKEIFDRGVRIRAIAELNKPNDNITRFIEEYQKENPNFLIRFSNPHSMITFAIRDDKELDFFLDLSEGMPAARALYTDNPQLITLVKDYFEYRWNTAMTEYPKKKAD